ncbi:MAG: type IV secretion system protein [Patescibacteria group bacterium]|nr:type IV secretion system protein [Patescibacteria group bacterium]
MNQTNRRTIIKFMFLLLPFFLLAIILPSKAFAFDLLPANSITPAYKILQNTSLNTMGGSIKTVWQDLLNVVNGIIIAVLIFIAFAQILRINVNTYGIKKILPALLLAVIAANFSFLFCRLLIDLANIVMSGIINSGVNKDNLTNAMNGGALNGWASPTNDSFSNMAKDSGQVFWFLIMQLLLIASGVIIYILAFLFFIRLWMIYFLVALAPLAFMATVLPATKSVFTQWWSNFAKWVFLPVVSVFWLWLGSRWLLTIANGNWFLEILFGGVCFYLAITTPFKMGGVVMQAWGNFGKKAWNNWATRKAKEKWVDPAIKEMKENIGSWYFNKAGGDPSFLKNPLGTLARRALFTQDRRADATRRLEGKINSGLREALGGKEYVKKDKDGNIMLDEKGEPIMVPKYMSVEKRRKIAARKDSINSDFGEYEWVLKQMDAEWKRNTKEGRVAARRTNAYSDRVTATENNLKISQLATQSESYGNEEGNEYLNDTSLGIIKGDKYLANMRNLRMASEEELEKVMELVAGKIKKDKGNSDFLPAADLNMILIRQSNALDKRLALNSLRDKGETLTKDGKSITDELADVERELHAIEGDFTRFADSIENDKGLYNKAEQKFTENAVVVKRMLDNGKGGLTRNIGDARSFIKLWGYDYMPEDIKHLMYTRGRKSVSGAVNDEKTSEKNKRSSFESAVDRAFNEHKFKSLTKQLVTGEIGAMTNDMKDAVGALFNAAVSANDVNAPQIYQMLFDTLNEAYHGAETEDGKNRVLNYIAESQRISYKQSLNATLSDSLEAAAKARLKQLGQEVKSGNDFKLQIQDLRDNDEEFLNIAENQLKLDLSSRTQADIEEINQSVDISYDKNGEIKIGFKGDDEKLVSLLTKTAKNSLPHDFRNRQEGKGMLRTGTIAGIRDSIEILNQETGSFIQKLREHKKVDRKLDVR